MRNCQKLDVFLGEGELNLVIRPPPRALSEGFDMVLTVDKVRRLGI